jgi:GntR family transcriptional regulator
MRNVTQNVLVNEQEPSITKEITMAKNWDADVPIYLQLYQQVIKRILDGYIKEGEALPSVRNVASEYQLNPVTISKAYQMLQDEQIVEKQRGKGLFVKSGVSARILDRERENFLQKEWPSVLEQIERLQLSPEQLLTHSQEK